MKLTLHTFMTLDGVMQAPGGPGEDDSGGFKYGGWSFTYGDQDFGETMTAWFADADAFLLGRKTYEIFAGYWPKQTDPNNPIATKLNSRPKYVASRTLKALDWQGSHLLGSDVPGEIAKLKEQPGKELHVSGSGNFAQTLIEHDLVDEYRLMYFPLHVGSGKKLFADGLKAGALRHLSTKTTSAGVVISTYAPAGEVKTGSVADAE